MKPALAQETQEEIDARLAQDAIDSGDHFEPTADDLADEATAAAPRDKKPTLQADIDLETLAVIVGEDKPKMVPHSRFNEVNEEAKAHRARVLELEEQLARANGKAAPTTAKDEPKPVEFDYDAAEELYSAAILDGDTAKAKSIRSDIRASEKAEAIRDAEAAADRRYTANRQKDDVARATTERDLAVAKAYVEYPFLDSASADANQDAIDEVLSLTNLFTSKGKSIGEALAAAVSRIGPRYAPAAEVVKSSAENVPDLRKGIDRARQIPAKATGLGARANTIDVRKLTGADIKKMSKEEDARLSGDEVN
ncbi:hypothetical protein QN399_16020 [Pseudomonas sp. 10C3]|uniref:hypothetical protein n=1 Tax=Pseudomonas sp. 10C3 TaxID=3118753 RepID=UPI002E815B63|nr:hypothetical protein [Pseudomonas sp. 10C3]MEE3507744.1 hypothetical protein [Pseudomonas sp. 10C3]